MMTDIGGDTDSTVTSVEANNDNENEDYDNDDDTLDSSLRDAVAEATAYLESDESSTLEQTIHTMAATQLCVHPEHSHSFAKVTFVRLLAANLRKCAGCNQPLKSKPAAHGGAGGEGGDVVKCVACNAFAHRYCALSSESTWKEPCPVNSKRVKEAAEAMIVTDDDEEDEEEEEDHEIEEEVEFEAHLEDNQNSTKWSSNRKRLNSFRSSVSAGSMESQELDLHEDEELLQAEQEELLRMKKEMGLLEGDADGPQQEEKEGQENNNYDHSDDKKDLRETLPQPPDSATRSPILSRILRRRSAAADESKEEGKDGRDDNDDTIKNNMSAASHDNQEEEENPDTNPPTKRAWLPLRKGIEKPAGNSEQEEQQAAETAGIVTPNSNNRLGSWFQRPEKQQDGTTNNGGDADSNAENNTSSPEQEMKSASSVSKTTACEDTENILSTPEQELKTATDSSVTTPAAFSEPPPAKPPSRFNLLAKIRNNNNNNNNNSNSNYNSIPAPEESNNSDDNEEETSSSPAKDKSESAVAEDQFSMFLDVDGEDKDKDADDDDNGDDDNFHDTVQEEHEQGEKETEQVDASELSQARPELYEQQSPREKQDEEGNSEEVPKGEGVEPEILTHSNLALGEKKSRARFSLFRKNKSADNADQVDDDEEEEIVSFARGRSLTDDVTVPDDPDAENKRGKLFEQFHTSPAFRDSDDDVADDGLGPYIRDNIEDAEVALGGQGGDAKKETEDPPITQECSRSVIGIFSQKSNAHSISSHQSAYNCDNDAVCGANSQPMANSGDGQSINAQHVSNSPDEQPQTAVIEALGGTKDDSVAIAQPAAPTVAAPNIHSDAPLPGCSDKHKEAVALEARKTIYEKQMARLEPHIKSERSKEKYDNAKNSFFAAIDDWVALHLKNDNVKGKENEAVLEHRVYVYGKQMKWLETYLEKGGEFKKRYDEAEDRFLVADEALAMFTPGVEDGPDQAKNDDSHIKTDKPDALASPIKNPARRSDQVLSDPNADVPHSTDEENPETVQQQGEEPTTPTPRRLRISSIFQRNRGSLDKPAEESNITEDECTHGITHSPKQTTCVKNSGAGGCDTVEGEDVDERKEREIQQERGPRLFRLFSKKENNENVQSTEEQSPGNENCPHGGEETEAPVEGGDKHSEVQAERGSHELENQQESGPRLFRLFSKKQVNEGVESIEQQFPDNEGSIHDGELTEVSGEGVGKHSEEQPETGSRLFRLFSRKDVQETAEDVRKEAPEDAKGEKLGDGKVPTDNGDEEVGSSQLSTTSRFSLFSGFRLNAKESVTMEESPMSDLSHARSSESPPSHWATATSTSFHTTVAESSSADSSGDNPDQDTAAPSEPLHYANHPFASVSRALQDNILALLGATHEDDAQSKKSDIVDEGTDDASPLKPKSTLSLVLSPESQNPTDDDVDIKQALGEIKPEPVQESTLKKLASGTYDTVKAVTSAKQKMGVASVAGGIAGGVAGLMFAGPAGAVMGVRYGQTAGMLGVVLEGSLTVGVIVAGVAGGRFTAERIQEQMKEQRVLTIGEHGVARKVMLVRPAIQIDPAWHEIWSQAQRTTMSSFSFNLFSGSDDIKHDRYEKTSDIVETEEDEIPTGEKVLLLVSRVLSDKDSFPGHVYRCLMQAFRDRCEMRKDLIREKEEFPHLFESSGEDSVNMGEGGTVSVSPRARREDAHGVIKYITATLLEVRPGLASTSAITEMTASVVEALVFGEVYDLVYEEIAIEATEKDKALAEKIDDFEYERYERLGIPLATEGLVSKAAIDELHRLPVMHSAADKLRRCVRFLEMISEHFAAASKAGSAIGADSLLKMVCQHIIAAKLSNINAEVAFLEEFARDEQLLRGKEGYALVTLQASLHFLNMSVDFERDIFEQENEEENIPIATS